MNIVNFREVTNDILKERLLYRKDKILKSISKQNRDFVRKRLNIFDDNFLDYIGMKGIIGMDLLIVLN